MSNPSVSESRVRFWKEQVEAWQASGQTQQAFCLSHDLNYARFGYWLRKFRRQAMDKPHTPSSGFVPVTQSTVADTTGLSLRLPDGLEIRGISTDNLPLLRQLLGYLS